jgi:hypothetical protein
MAASRGDDNRNPPVNEKEASGNLRCQKRRQTSKRNQWLAQRSRYAKNSEDNRFSLTDSFRKGPTHRLLLLARLSGCHPRPVNGYRSTRSRMSAAARS